MSRAASVLDVLLPGGCAVCSAAVPGDRPPLCELCASRLEPVPPPRCPRCGATRLLEASEPDRCPECAGWPDDLRASSACLHRGVAAELVRGLKYRGYTALAPLLGQAMVAPASVLVGRSVPLLVPVPLSAGRRRERGFNQAAVLARALGAASGWAVGELLARPAGGPALARRRRREREALAPHAYALRRPIPDLSLGPPILIVDDVITTGSTVAACVALLRDTGARCVGAVSFTRTVVAPEPG